MDASTTDLSRCHGSARSAPSHQPSDPHQLELPSQPGASARVPGQRVIKGWPALGAIALAAFVIFAVAIEVVAAQYSESPVPSWTVGAFPLTWSQSVRVVWWLTVAAAAFGSRVLMKRAGVRVHWWITVLSVGPFVIFALGVAWGMDWATWH